MFCPQGTVTEVVKKTASALIICISHSYQSPAPGQSEPELDTAKQQPCISRLVAVRGIREGFRKEVMAGLGTEGRGDPHHPPPVQVFSWVLVIPTPYFRACEASFHTLVSFRNKKGRMTAVATQQSMALKQPQELVGEGTCRHPILSSSL